MQSFGALNHPYCLCDGLEVIASNAAFDTLFTVERPLAHPMLIDRLLGNQQTVENLFSYSGITVEMAVPEQNRNISITLHKAMSQSGYVVLELEDRTQTLFLTRALNDANAMDTQSGAYNAGVFVQKMQALLKKPAQKALLVNLRLSSINRHEQALQYEQRGELLQKLNQKMSHEFGSDCFIGRTDALSLSLLMPTSGDDGEDIRIIAQAKRLCSNTLRQFSSPLKVDAGAARYPDHANDAASLIANAALTLEQAELDFFTNELREKADRRSALMNDLPTAIDDGAIAPYFQPVIDAQSNTLIGFEALIRWTHPELGYVIPPDIINMATESNLLHKLTAQILTAAVEQAMNWPEQVHFAINVTPSQLNPALIDLVRKTVRGNHIDPSRIEIEVTEEALFDDFDASADIIARLRAIGVCVAMDDFGAGYTSLGNLRKLAFSKFKIDKSISDGLPHDAKTIAIVRSLMIMAKELQVEVTVEGIETEDQLDFLRAFDCGIQGYIFSPPLPPDALHKMRPFLAKKPPTRQSGKIVSIKPKKAKR